MHKELVDRDKYEKIHGRLAACYEISVVLSIAFAAIALMGALLFGNIEEVGRAMAMTRDTYVPAPTVCIAVRPMTRLSSTAISAR